MTYNVQHIITKHNHPWLKYSLHALQRLDELRFLVWGHPGKHRPMQHQLHRAMTTQALDIIFRGAALTFLLQEIFSFGRHHTFCSMSGKCSVIIANDFPFIAKWYSSCVLGSSTWHTSSRLMLTSYNKKNRFKVKYSLKFYLY